MPGSTPVYGITYPVPSDPLSEGADAIRDTAETVEGALVEHVPQVEAARDQAVAAVNSSAAAVTTFRRFFLLNGV